MHVPRVVTFEVGSDVRKREGCFAPLAADELVSVVNAAADLRIPAIRFSLHDMQAVDSLSRAAEHARRRGAETTIVLAGVLPEDGVLRELHGARPVAIAVPLHVHETSTHDLIPGRTKAWEELGRVAAAVRTTGMTLEVETRVMRPCAVILPFLSEAVAELGAARWRLDFSGARLRSLIASAAAEAILDIATRNALDITVQGLPFLSPVLARRVRSKRPLPDLRLLHPLRAADTLRVTRCGDIYVGGAAEPAGNVRQHAIEALVGVVPSAARNPRRIGGGDSAPAPRLGMTRL